MKLTLPLGSTSNVIRVKLYDASSNSGAGLAGLTNASTGLIISTICDNEAAPVVYTVAAGNVESITTLGTYAAPTAGKCRFKEVDPTNHKGIYELQIADARFNVANSRSMIISIAGVTNLIEQDVEIQFANMNAPTAVQIRQEMDANSTKLANLDATTSSRLAGSAYTAPDNASITAIKTKTDALPSGIKKNTALNSFMFPMVDTNGNPATGLTVTAQRSIDGAAFAACANAVVELGNGVYKINLATGDLNGNVIALKFTATGARQRNLTITTES